MRPIKRTALNAGIILLAESAREEKTPVLEVVASQSIYRHKKCPLLSLTVFARAVVIVSRIVIVIQEDFVRTAGVLPKATIPMVRDISMTNFQG